MCSSLESLLPVFEFIDARLRRGHGGEVRIEATSMWVGAQAWRRARARGDRRRLPTPFRRETQPTAKPQPVLVVENIFLADLEFRRFPWDLTQKRDLTRRRSLGLNPGAVRRHEAVTHCERRDEAVTHCEKREILRIDAGLSWHRPIPGTQPGSGTQPEKRTRRGRPASQGCRRQACQW